VSETGHLRHLQGIGRDILRGLGDDFGQLCHVMPLRSRLSILS
jgi:hypothetical protein